MQVATFHRLKGQGCLDTITGGFAGVGVVIRTGWILPGQNQLVLGFDPEERELVVKLG